MSLQRGINLRSLAEKMGQCSGAEVRGICTEAGNTESPHDRSFLLTREKQGCMRSANGGSMSLKKISSLRWLKYLRRTKRGILLLINSSLNVLLYSRTMHLSFLTACDILKISKCNTTKAVTYSARVIFFNVYAVSCYIKYFGGAAATHAFVCQNR